MSVFSLFSVPLKAHQLPYRGPSNSNDRIIFKENKKLILMTHQVLRQKFYAEIASQYLSRLG